MNESNSLIKEGFSDRLRASITGSNNSFAEKCGFGESLLRKYLNGESYPGIEKAAQIATAAGVCLDWLIMGRGPMRSEDASYAYPLEGYREDEGWITFPIYDAHAAAGAGNINKPRLPTPGIAFDPELSNNLFHTPKNTLAGLYVTGDSMEPTLYSGDVLIVDMSTNEIVGDAIYVLVVDEGCIVKRIQPRTDGKIVLSSDNPNYPPEIIEPEKKSFLKIYGRVVGALKKF